MIMVWDYIVLLNNLHRIVLYVWQQMKEGGEKELKIEYKIGFD